MPISDLIPWRKKRKTKIPVKVRQQPVRIIDGDTNRPSDELCRWFGLAPFGVLGGWSGIFGPRMDMVEDGQRFTVTLELPGIDKEDIDVTLSADRLTIQGEQQSEKKHHSRSTYGLQRSRKAFRRSVVLPCQIAADHVEATLRRGVLTINLPKAEQVQDRKRIPVRSR
jgi:HSP20 family protein